MLDFSRYSCLNNVGDKVGDCPLPISGGAVVVVVVEGAVVADGGGVLTISTAPVQPGDSTLEAGGLKICGEAWPCPCISALNCATCAASR